jgi:hypothetical protein
MVTPGATWRPWANFASASKTVEEGPLCALISVIPLAPPELQKRTWLVSTPRARLRQIQTSVLPVQKVGFAANTSSWFSAFSGGNLSQAHFRKRSIE